MRRYHRWIRKQYRSVWQVKLSDLALSLASRSGLHKTFDRDRRSAFVTMDFEASMGRQATGSGQQLQVSIAKVHAVMQPSSIGELGDFVDHLQAEVLIRKEQRATELAEFKEKTKSLMRSLDVKIGETQVAEASWLDMYTFSLAIRNIGVAFPLTLNQNLQMPRSTSQDTAAVRAFLFSIKSLEFGTEQGESGQAAMKGFSFQFVSRFRQSNATDFSGDTHKTRNRLVYPEMTAHLHSERVSGSRRIRIGADVSGFILDVDSTIPDFISSLIDVYRHGKDRMERLANNIPRSSPNAEKLPHIETVATEKQYRALPTSNVLASLTFASGKVRMHSRQHGITSSRARPLSTLIYGLSEEPVLGAEEFDLPVVSVWIEFRATPASRKLSVSTTRSEPSTLLFKSTIHSSQNTLRPTLLPFLSELMDNVENHMRQSSWRNSQISPARTHELLPSVTTGAIPARDSDPVSSMKISFSLRIDQSKLHLTCRPDANVVAGLHWDSGGFIVNISRGAQHISFTGTVGGLTVWLRHGFLSEDCVRLDARNLAFAIAFAKVESQPDKVSTSVSVVVDTEFSGGIRFSRLQDVLCFKAVWLDRIPVFAGRSISSPGMESSKSAGSSILGTSSSAKQELTTAVLMRLRQVHLDIDLGQSITNIKLKLDDTLIRTKITEASAELSLSITKLSILATGNVSGQADLPDFRFQTIRKSESHHDNMAGSRMLDLTMTSGGLNIKLESEYHELIHYRAEPLAIMIFDDWSRIAPEIPVDDRRVHLSFVVSGTEVVAVMNVGTIPKLVSYVNKFTANLETQREGARRESKALGTASTPKPNNPLSAVASVMLKSARTRLKESEAGFSYVIGQRMSLKLNVLRLVVFPRSMRDAELAQFIGEDVHARLDRLVESDIMPAKRDLQLSFSSITISKVNQLHHTLVTKDPNAKDQLVDTRQWLASLVKGAPEAIIFALPSMDMRMRSAESIDDGKRVLSYDFSSKFSKEGVKNAEDIYISLNMSLYSWLTVLRKSFAREMEQVQAAADVRVGPTSLAQPALSMSVRRKSPDILPSSQEESDAEAVEQPPTRPGRGSVSIPHSRSFPYPAHTVDDMIMPPAMQTSIPKAVTSPTPPSKAAMTGIAEATAAMPSAPTKKTLGITYVPKERHIERLTMRQLGEATPDVMHPFFMKKAGFSLEDSLPQYVHEYATMPTEEIMKVLLKLYSKQLARTVDEPSETKGLHSVSREPSD
ncbi:hypothetical protein A0H81_11867 [Grifola frondosa]|uniref:Uncharacterized protein n=1 Tax=Grifola frondosa TaxID=5627 RepID=A0A1C7LVP4_GRIFR|nr:hypothetical protein A0H81_11867 [Grifola frondosa]